MNEDLVKNLLSKHSYLTERASVDVAAVNCPSARLLDFLKEMRDEYGFDMLMDVTAVDWDQESPRFTVMYHLLSTSDHVYLRVASDCEDDLEPEIPSVCGLWPGANWHERETYDMFGIKFSGHPDLRRILMWDTYPYFPLRKEFPLAGIEVPLPSEETTEATKATVRPAPMMGGPFHSATRKGHMSEKEPRARDESWTERHVKPVKRGNRENDEDGEQ